MTVADITRRFQPIDTAPKDRPIYARCVFNGHIVSEGLAVWGLLADIAPARRSADLDPLGRLTAEDYAREDQLRAAYVAKERWLTADRLYTFPTPTDWREAEEG